MKVKTQKAAHTVKFASLMSNPEELMIVYPDSRSAVEIAAEWEENKEITIVDSRENETMVEGYTRLVRLIRDTPKEVCICLQKDVNANG